ncbi:unnamed protein product, partial [Phaedon cochleariae]
EDEVELIKAYKTNTHSFYLFTNSVIVCCEVTSQAYCRIRKRDSFWSIMGSVLSWLGYGVDTGRTDDADPLTKLTSRDRYLVKKSWESIVMKQPTEYGIRLFMRLFEIQPNHQKPFPFRDIPTQELPKSKKFHAHCNSVIYSVGSMVGAIDDNELLESIGLKIGSNHKTRSVDRQALKDVKQAMTDVFSFMTKEELDAWSRALDIGLKYMTQGIEERK